MYYEKIFRALDERKIRYAVAGGIAMVLHGAVRFTADLDLIVDFEPENVNRFLSIVDELGYRPRNPVAAAEFVDPAKRKLWQQEKNMVVFSFVHSERPMELIDVFVSEPIPFAEIARELVKVSAKGITIPVVSLRHLKRLKQDTGRVQDQKDVQVLNSLDEEGASS
jgi:hypothetical protein